MKYGIKPALSIIAASVDLTNHKLGRVEHIQSQVLHRWIGEHYMHEIGANKGTGNPIEYTEKDIRRAIAYLRLINLIGAGLGKEAAKMRERAREVASWHTNGWVVVVEDAAWWTDDTDVIWTLIDGDKPYMTIPCYVHLLTPSAFVPLIPDA